MSYRRYPPPINWAFVAILAAAAGFWIIVIGLLWWQW